MAENAARHPAQRRGRVLDPREHCRPRPSPPRFPWPAFDCRPWIHHTRRCRCPLTDKPRLELYHNLDRDRPSRSVRWLMQSRWSVGSSTCSNPTSRADLPMPLSPSALPYPPAHSSVARSARLYAIVDELATPSCRASCRGADQECLAGSRALWPSGPRPSCPQRATT